MFTGLIEAVCAVRSIRRDSESMRLTVEVGSLAGEVEIGDSIAVNGVCLTVSELGGGIAAFEVSGETLAKSNLGKLGQASRVNVERALKVGGRLGGHFVQGHIDGTAAIKAVDVQGRFAEIKFAAAAELVGQMVVKGSVAIDGVSLTIARLDEGSFGVAVIPQTLEATTLGRVKVGDLVNIEIDMISKIVHKQLEKILPQNQKLTVEKLKQLGF